MFVDRQKCILIPSAFSDALGFCLYVKRKVRVYPENYFGPANVVRSKKKLIVPIVLGLEM